MGSSLAGRAPGQPDGVITHRPRNLDPKDTQTRLWIPTTTATRTTFDLSATLPQSQLRKTFERAQRLGLLDLPRLEALLASAPARKGSGHLRALLAQLPPPLAEIRSYLET